MSQWGVMGLFFKAMMLPTAYLCLSKKDSRIFLLQEVLSYTFMAAIMIGGFKYYGLPGLGVGMLLTGVFDWFTVWIISLICYNFHYSSRVWHLFALQFPLLVATLVVVIATSGWLYVLIGTLCVASSMAFSVRFLYRNTDFIHRLLVKVRRTPR
jgi:hypothetical protein